MKLHLPIGLRKALMAVFAALVVSPAMAAPTQMNGTDVNVKDSKTYKEGLEMLGSDSNKITGRYLGSYVGYPATVTASKGHITMYSTNGYNAVHGVILSFLGSPKVEVSNGDFIMDGPANVIALGSSVTGNRIIMQNSEKQTIEIGTVANGILGDDVGKYVPSQMAGISGNFNILQDATVGKEGTTLVSMDAATANLITGGSDVKASDIELSGGASVIVDTTLGNLLSFAADYASNDTMDLNKLLEGEKDVSATLSAGNNLVFDSVVNMVHGGKGGVELKADNQILAGGALNVFGGNTTLTANNINLTPYRSTSITHMADELSGLLGNSFGNQFNGFMSFIIGELGPLATQNINVSMVAGGANLTSTGKDSLGNGITTGGTVGLLMNTPVSAAINELLSPGKDSSEYEIILSLLQKGEATTLTAKQGNILVGSQFNLLHGGNFAFKEEDSKNVIDRGKNSLTVKAENGNVNVEGTANVVSGNVVVNAKDITMTGEVLSNEKMANALGSFVGGMNIPGADTLTSTGILNKLVNKGSVNMVTGGAMLDATGDITMTGSSVDDKEKIGNINAVIDTEIVDVLQAKDGDFSSLVQGGGHMTTLQADGNINLEGRVNVVNGKYVTLDAGKDINLQGNLSMISGATVKADGSININTSPEETYKMYMDAEELGALLPKDSSYTKLLTQMGVTDKLGHTGINGAVVAGGANLTAVGNITTGGTASILVNTPMAEVGDRLMSLLTNPKHDDEIWMVKELLQKGVATTVTSTNGNIELGSRLNVLHGGNFTTVEGGNALSLNAANGAVKLDGTINMVSGNVQVKANNIELKGNKNVSLNLTPLVSKVLGSSSEYAGLVTGSGMLDKVAVKGINANVVMGGATLKATALETATGEKVGGNIELSGMANFVLDTQLENVVDAIIETNPQYVVDGGDKLTYLKADGNIDLTGRLNVVNGAYVKLEAGKDVNINGTLNMVSGKAKVNGANINLNGQNSVGLNWDEIIPGDIGNYADGTGLTDKLNKGVNGNLVLGGSTLTATNDIKMTGMASVVTNVPLGSAFEALNKKMDQTWQPELWLMKEMLNDGIATTLTAENGNIEMTSRLNMLHGGNFGENGANALTLEAKNGAVILAGTANIISGNTQVTGGSIQITGKTGVGFDWDKVVDVLPDKYAGYGELAGDMGILAKLEKGVNGSVIAGGATLTAKSGDITMEGMATAVVDVTLNNVIEAVETQNGTPIMEGGTHATTITAEKGNINMNSRLNLVNGGKVTLKATEGSVNMNGTFNTVSGNANVIAGRDINMIAQNKVGVDISPMLDGHYADIAKDLGMADVLKNGVSSNIVAGGAKLQAEEGDVVMSGVATAIVDTTASNVIGAVKGDNLGELMKGGRDTTVVKAGKDIVLKSQMNVVNGGNSTNAGGVLLDAGNNVIVGGQVSVVNRAEIKAGQNVNFNSGNTVVKYSDITAGKVAFTGKTAEITNVKFNNASVDVLNAHLVNTLGSEVAMNNLNVADMGSIENLGSLSLKDAAISNGTLYNAGSIMVNGVLTLESATLSFAADSLTMNSSAIVLGEHGSIFGVDSTTRSGVDLIAGLNFELSYDVLEFTPGSNEFRFNLAIFQGATRDERDLLAQYIQDGELSITLDNGYIVDVNDGLQVVFTENGGVVSITGTASVPEPTTATLSLLALAALAARRRRK